MPRLLLLLFLLLACTCVRAQNSEDVVQEVESADNYFFRVELEGKAKQLMECTNELTDGHVALKRRGRLLPYSIDDNTKLAVNIRRRLLTIEHDGDDPEERKRMKEQVAEARECLSLPATTVTTEM